MKNFSLHLCDSTNYVNYDDVNLFIGEDGSGSFGIQAHHSRFMTVLEFGLSRFCRSESDWYYLAMPGGVLSFNDNVLTISTRHFSVDKDLDNITRILTDQLKDEEEAIKDTRLSLMKMEQSLFKQIAALQRKTG